MTPLAAPPPSPLMGDVQVRTSPGGSQPFPADVATCTWVEVDGPAAQHSSQRFTQPQSPMGRGG